MITPTKGIAPQRALLAVGAQIAQAVSGPVTVSQAWTRLKLWRLEHGHSSPIPFWWFTLALDVLHALGLADFEDELIVVRSADASAPSRSR